MPTTGSTSIQIVKASGQVIPVTTVGSFEGDGVALISRDLDLGDDARQKYVDAIQFDITGRGLLTYLKVEVWTRDRHEDDLRLIGVYPLAHADTVIFTRFTARYVRLKIKDTLPLTRWKLSKISFFGKGFDPQTGRGTQGRL